MSTQIGPGADGVATPWSVDEWRTLLALRTRHLQGGDRFTATELARLWFVRWLGQMDEID